MKIAATLTALTLSLALSAPIVAQCNMSTNQAEQHQLDKDHRADKKQAKADKAEKKALNSHKVRKADKKQDEANHAADRADNPGK